MPDLDATADAAPRGLGDSAGTWHLSSNRAITVDGDTATDVLVPRCSTYRPTEPSPQTG